MLKLQPQAVGSRSGVSAGEDPFELIFWTRRVGSALKDFVEVNRAEMRLVFKPSAFGC